MASEDENREGGKVIPFPVKFAGDDGVGDPAPEMRDAEQVHDDRCRHRKTTFDKKARTVTCDACGVNVDVFEVLEDVVDWIRRHRWEWDELQRQGRESALAEGSFLKRITRSGQSGVLLIGRCHVAGYHTGRPGIPTDAIVEGDYVSRNRIYRARREGEGWAVVFYDPAHGMKNLPNLRRQSLPKVRQAITKHWLWLNNNGKAAGLA